MHNQSLHSRITAFEQSLDEQYRYQFGVHYTPPTLIKQVLETAFEAFMNTHPEWTTPDPITICDPSCGAGAFLIDAAEYLLYQGIEASRIVNEVLIGIDIDANAVDLAITHLRDWATTRGVNPDSIKPQIYCADALGVDWQSLPGIPPQGVDIVIGNPPFLGQLSAKTSRSAAVQQALSKRFGFVVGYADTSALFILQSLELAAEGGVVALVQPQSILAGSSTTTVRQVVSTRATLHSLWGCDDSLFDAEVRVCVPTLIKNNAATYTTTDELDVAVTWGLPVTTSYVATHGSNNERWSPLVAQARGVPAVQIDESVQLSEIASATAGFRDEFYALSKAAIDLEVANDNENPLLISVGMIDVNQIMWGKTPRRIGGKKFQHPRVDLAQLNTDSPRIATWVQHRMQPKVLVATQTKVIEAVGDPQGTMVPLTPVVSVEPRDGNQTTCGLIAAVLNSPVASAWAVAQFLGTGLSATSVRLSAKSTLMIPLPRNHELWAEAAAMIADSNPAGINPSEQTTASHSALLDKFGHTMCAAYEISNIDEVMQWWHSRR